MPPNYKGALRTELNDWSFDPETGAIDIRRVRGKPDIVYAEANALAAAGWNPRTSRDGPYVNLVAVRHRPDVTYTSVVRWSLSTEQLVKPIWGLAKISSEATSFDDGNGNAGPCAYKKLIENAVRDGTDLPASLSGLAQASKVLIELIRGVRGYEHEFLKLTRTVNFNFQTVPPSGNLVLDNKQRLVYTTAQLVANEGIPVGVQFQLPTDTQDAPTATAYVTAANPTGQKALWGWRLREQEARLDTSTTGTHTTAWIHAQWSLLPYQPAT